MNKPGVDTWPPGEALMVQWRGKWMTWDEMFWARLNELMPRQPKKQWGR